MTTPPFRRLVLEVGQDSAGAATLRGAAELARVLGLGLHCVLVEDEALFGLPALPFARELRLPTHEWRSLDRAALAEEFAHMAAALRSTLAALGTRLGIAHGLEVQRGNPESLLLRLCGAGDIIVLAAADTVRPRAHQEARLHEMARLSAASVLLLPAVPAPAGAGVAALLAGPDDPSLAVAARIAADTDAALLLVLDAAAWGTSSVPAALARARGAPVLILETRAAAQPGDVSPPA